ncbi:MAG: branched-chain amino acid ABC transporter permease [Actinobacteria bacterium]|nr:branched-chain amino acid ABC transporter permease [Actinomycetota bacterium]
MASQARTEPPSQIAALLSRPRPSLVAIIGILVVLALIAWLVANFVKDPAEFVNVFLIGLTRGAVYALVALGYTLVYGILQLINFAHGDQFALAGLLASSVLLSVFNVTDESGAGIVIVAIGVTLLIAMVFAATTNTVIERVAYRPLRQSPRLAALITAIGMSFIVQNVALGFYDTQFQSIPRLVPNSDVFSVGGVALQWNKFFVLLLTIPVLLALTWLVTSTRHGKAMRATSMDPDAAAMMGINVNRTISFTFALAGALAGAAGLLYLLYFTTMRFDTGFELGLIAFTAAVLGGIGNLTGAVLGGILIGLVQEFNEGLTVLTPGGDWTRSIVFGILIAILVFRPSGLLGEQTPEGG